MRKINRRNFLKVTGVLAAASALAACGGSSTSTAGSTGSTAGSAASADGAKAYNELTVGTDNTDLKADLKIISTVPTSSMTAPLTLRCRIPEAVSQHHHQVRGITDYANDMTTRLTSNDWGDLCMIPTNIPLTELGDYFEPLCALSDIENDYNFASNRAYNAACTASPPPAMHRASSTTRRFLRLPASPPCPRPRTSSWMTCRRSRTTILPLIPCTPTTPPAGP
mgnify:CR=1 FL=1